MKHRWQRREKKLRKRRDAMRVSGKSVFLLQRLAQEREEALRKKVELREARNGGGR